MLVSSLDMTIVMDREEVLMTPKKKKKNIHVGLKRIPR